MINFTKVRFRNFMSYGNQFTEVDLNQNDITLIVGKNGNGKSVIEEAIVFALFGRPYRNINKPQLVNSINQKDCVTEIEFSTNNIQYRVVRGLKPAVFEIYINGVLLDQSSKSKDYQDFFESTILKMNYKTFTQVVILGTASYVPFMELTAANRREIVEDILGIQIFSVMNDIIKEKTGVIKEQYNRNDYDISVCKEKITLIEQHIAENEKRTKVNVDSLDQAIADQRVAIDSGEKQIFSLKQALSPVTFLQKQQEEHETKRRELLELKRTLEIRLKSINKELDFYDAHQKCPTCAQEITTNFKTLTTADKHKSRKEILAAVERIVKDLTVCKDQIDNLSTKIQKFSDFQNQIYTVESSVANSKRFITTLENQKQSMTKSVVDDSQKDRLVTEKGNLDTLEKERQAILKIQNDYAIMASLLKDGGIKSTIIKQYLPVMNKLINKYLSDMDFFINFNFTENFSEAIKSRNREDFSYASFSEGEKFKINLALLFTWREIAKLRNSATTNLLFLDEVMDSSLDLWGTESVLKLIHQLKSTNTFIISHKVDILQDKFKNIYTVTKDKAFSKLSK